jgi:hypothetical protein
MLLAFPNTHQTVTIYWYWYCIFLFFLTIGFFSRTSAIMVFLGLTTMHNHQPYNLNGGDSMMHLLAFAMMFGNCGGALSVDRLIKRALNPTFGEASRPKPCAPVGQRMIMVQIVIAYWATSCWKFHGKQWLDGEAVYYATRLEDLQKQHITILFDNPIFCKFLTYYTLVVEFAMCSLVWIKDLRYWILLACAGMHIGIDSAINLPNFEWLFMTSYWCFADPKDLEKVMTWIKARIAVGFGPAAVLAYNPSVLEQASMASVIEGLDVFGRLQITAKPGTNRITAEIPGGTLTGMKLFSWLTLRLPILFFVYPLFGLPYQIMAKPAQPAQPAAESQSVPAAEPSTSAVSEPPSNGISAPSPVTAPSSTASASTSGSGTGSEQQASS